MKRGDFVEVKWSDAKSVAEWLDFDNLPTLAKNTTRGWIAKLDKDVIVLYMTTSDVGEEEPHIGDCIVIPAPWTTHIRLIEEGGEEEEEENDTDA